ncbi:Methyltransferase type 11 [Ignavibacterium album JCM 16511]|uniref:Methyltransferase type 11 n=1 Tax=Ignavibacterium album (strain DSM 19864 / JCM 16511 / NBRC 101810 / Mat9-16) TaxID=945713 RepID=I0AP67_IGNAJ|nr:class I SAM-dependent methyltransferase [Ignavibacterium album]AFH50774.1 Methyltransferase type 11 [Ignavibacterium album JCM 16511]
MNCKICDNKSSLAFTAKVLNKYDVKYFKCNSCGYLFTENPYWLDEAYKNPINISDTGIIMRNIYFSKIVSSILYFCYDKSAKFLDYAGGYGIFTRLMRDIGFDFYWHDDYTTNLLARGFEKSDEQYELLTAFEVFEHFDKPVEELEKMLKLSDSILFSTVSLPQEIPQKDWWYYGFEHGQHISFYSEKTLKTLALKFGLNFYPFKNLFLITRKKLNPLKLKLIFILSHFGLNLYIKLRMNSLTEADNKNLLKHH